MKNLFTALALMAAMMLSPLTLAHSDGHGHGAMTHSAEAVYACPMHPKVQGQQGDECPKCGMKLQAMAQHHKGCDKANCPKHQGMQQHHKDCDKANCPKHQGMQQHHKDCDKANCPKHQGMQQHHKGCDKVNCPKHQGMQQHHKDCDKANCPKHQGVQHHQGHYTHACPMNPKVVGMAGDSCPVCGMDLEPVAKADRQAYTHACPMNPAIRGFAGDSCPKCGMDLEPMASTTSGHQHH
ncbi:heavy metal-binding domain-containing protein [Ferrimonas sp. SCSIO 43195]|uniref:heavy metal-binding domain-containing protein n=1 Tax=Ferrimonas sp. SCSIO 43195 TaxID=2822844 RepID=UPI0020751D29|nr:heavy metal-binding domain-containing protein [Ferrimonas sp. SCSIO 43195]USD37760.1 hypothetical protein J8Z22_00805 [Ferrimonas sp. SCSIO 43195]